MVTENRMPPGCISHLRITNNNDIFLQRKAGLGIDLNRLSALEEDIFRIFSMYAD